MTATKFDAVIPCFEPKPGWAQHLANCFATLKEILPDYRLNKVVVVNDGSTQNIQADLDSIADSLVEFELIEHQQNQGKGAAIRTGLTKCHSPIILFTDIDIPYRLEDMATMIKAIEHENVDMALGIRGTSYYDSLSGFRRLVSKALIALNKLLFDLKVGDTQGGLKVMNQSGKEAVLQTAIKRYLFDLEAVKIATKNGLVIKGIEVRLQPGIQLPSLGLNVLIQESSNLLKLLFTS